MSKNWRVSPRMVAPLLVALLMGMMVVVAACSSAAPAPSPAGTSAPAAKTEAGPAKNLRLATSLNELNPLTLGAVELAKKVKEKSDGKLTIDVLPNAQLGTDRTLIEGMQMGTIDMVVTGSAPLGGFVPKLQVIDLPFVFKSYDHARSVVDGPFSEDLKKLFEGSGFRSIGFWEIGLRHVTNSRGVIKTPEDVKGLKIRVVENPIHQLTWSLLGGQPTPMGMSEVYNALQQKTIDAQENPLNQIITEKLFEVQKHVSLTAHVYTAAVPMISDKAWASLTEAERKIMLDAAKEATAYERGIAGGQEAEQRKFLESKGVQIEANPDRDKFSALVKPVYEEYTKKYGTELYEKLKSLN